MGKDIPCNFPKVAEMLNYVCKEKEDSISYFILVTMLLTMTEDKVNANADNVTPKEARGEKELIR